jgi:PKD repeat protein
MPIAPIARPVPLPIPQPLQSAAPVNLSYWGGPIMPFTENALVLWGGAGHTSSLTAGLPGFLTAFANAGNANPYNVALEYRTQGQSGTTTNQPLTIASRYLGTYTITPTIPATNLSDGDVAAELAKQIAAGALPPPRVAFGGPVTEYYVMFPPAYSICLGSDCSNVQFCAYHSDASYAGTPFTYAVLPESTPPDPGCGANSAGDGFGNLTSMTSHEMVESMTDPEVGSAQTFGPPLAWYDVHNGEVADICNGQEATLTIGGGSWVVQDQWSNAERGCIVSHSAAGLKGVLANFTMSATAGGAVTVDASGTTSPNGTGTISNYAWDWGDGTSSGGASPTAGHAYTNAGTHVVTLLATDASGASGARFLLVTTQGLSVGVSGPGQVTSAPAGISCGGTCAAIFLDGTTVSLTATPNPGASFSGWSGDCAGQPATCVVTMGGARTATASFTVPTPPPPPPVVCSVPNVRGRTLAAAKTALLAAHCSVGTIALAYSKTIAKGLVISQSVAAGRQLTNGATVNLVVSKGRPPAKVTLCYRHRTIRVTKAVARKLRRHGATPGACPTRRR